MIALAGAAASAGTWHAHPEVWLLVVVVGGGYVIATRDLGPRHLGVEGTTGGRSQACFWAGLCALWIGADWPIHDLSENYLLSAHMVQHLLFTFVAPPLLLLGMPAWLLRGLLRSLRLLPVVKFLARPIVALVLFNFVIAVTHWPVVLDAAVASEPLHFGIHFVLFTTATLMWWPVVDPLPETPSLSEPAKMFYLFLQSIVPTVPASFLTFAGSPLYSSYERFPRIWPWLNPLLDQRVAGLTMKLVGGLLLWVVIGVIWFRWNAREEARDRGDVEWDDFERELQTYNMRP